MPLFHSWLSTLPLFLRSEPFAKPKNFITLQKRMDFSEVTGGRALSFRDVSMGEAAALSLSRRMWRVQDSPVDMLLKRQAREPWPPARRAYAQEGTEEKFILVKKI